MKIAPIDQSKLAKTDEEYLYLLAGDADWIARTPDDMQQLRETGEGPFAKLPEDDFRAFLAGLEFKAGGVGGGYYKPLMSSLTLSEIFEVFARFGMSSEYALRTHDAKCIGGTNCEFEVFHFCPSSVCHAVVE
jgi:hypothetical protein